MHSLQRRWTQAALALTAIVAVTVVLGRAGITHGTTVALAYLLVVLFVAATAILPIAIGTSIVSMLALNYFFLPPVGTFTVADPNNWAALGAFLVVALVASHLSSVARTRAAEAVEGRDQLARLFDLSRDVLLSADTDSARAATAAHVARRFGLDTVAIAIPAREGGWTVVNGGETDLACERTDLDRVMAATMGTLEFDATARSYGGQRVMENGRPTRLVPIRLGTRPVGVLALSGRPIEPGTADAIAGIVAVALERATVLAERQVAELSRQRADLSTALLASLGHDLRTPLTAIRVAVGNLEEEALSPEQKREQLTLALAQIDHLSRLLQEILDMARIDAGAVRPQRQWVTPADVVDAAIALVGRSLDDRPLRVDADDDRAVELDPRLTSAALAHVLENAVRYSPPSTTVAVEAHADEHGMMLAVTDDGPGLEPADLERLFEPFVRGRIPGAGVGGTGLGLAITRGLLGAQGGRVWAENAPGHGARFVIVVPAAVRPSDPAPRDVAGGPA